MMFTIFRQSSMLSVVSIGDADSNMDESGPTRSTQYLSRQHVRRPPQQRGKHVPSRSNMVVNGVLTSLLSACLFMAYVFLQVTTRSSRSEAIRQTRVLISTTLPRVSTQNITRPHGDVLLNAWLSARIRASSHISTSLDILGLGNAHWIHALRSKR